MAMSYIKLYYDFRKTLKSMPDDAAGRLIKAIFDYVVEGTEPDLYNGEQYVFLMLQSQLDRDKEAYEKTVARNQENGKNGGRPKKSETQENPVGFLETQENQEEPIKSQDKTKTKIKEDKTKTKTKEEDKDNIREIDNPFAVADIVRPKFDTLESYASTYIENLNADSMDELVSYRDVLPDEVIRHAIKRACDNGAPRYSYVEAIINGYISENVKSLEDAKSADERFKQQKGGGRNGARTNQRQNAVNRGDTTDKPKPACAWDVIL